MKVSSTYPATWLAEVGPQARRAEELGYDNTGTGEMAHDPMILATAAALATETIEIGTLAAWSLVHGLAELMLNGRVERPATTEALREMVGAVTRTLEPVA